MTWKTWFVDYMVLHHSAEFGQKTRLVILFTLLALLDSPEEDKDPHDAFHEALECLSTYTLL